jgi:hypothetical protein
MFVQINTDNHTSGNESWTEPLRIHIGESLQRFNTRVTSFLVHLADENSSKSGSNDKRCVIEARIDGMQPLTVTSHSGTYEQAVKSAIDKMKSALDSTLERNRDH